MKNRNRILIVSLFVLIVAAGLFLFLRQDRSEKSSLLKVSFRQGWFTYAGYAGEVFAMDNSIDSVNGIELTVEQGADDIDPVKLVLSGGNDLGITSAEAVYTANEKGAHLVIVGVVNYQSPTCFISLKKNNIHAPSDLEGKKVGILTGSETETIYRTMVSRLKLNTANITEVEAPYDLKTFIQGEYDVYPGFYYSEPVSLDFQKIEYNVIKPSDYGINLVGAVYFTTEKLLKEHPEKVKGFVNSIALGWEKAIANPQLAIHKLYAYDNKIDTTRELASLNKGLDYFKGEASKVLYASPQTFRDEKQALFRLNKIKDTASTQSVNLRYVEEFHQHK